jgi:DUF1365 family protein
MDALLFFGDVMHSRLRPRRNRFRYPVFFLRFRVDRMASLRAPLLSVDRWNLFSVYRRDHGPRDGSDLSAWIRHVLAASGMHRADGEIWLQAFPRVLGYVFNPVSFWLCHDHAGALRAVLCEVSNTFGERHNYLLAHEDQRAIEAGDWLTARKMFHVSPFCDVRGGYRFQFAVQGAHCAIRIDYDDGEGMLLATAVRGASTPLSTRALWRAFLLYPWMTLAVIVRIHWQALRLWRKGVPFFRKPHPPAQGTTR